MDGSVEIRKLSVSEAPPPERKTKYPFADMQVGECIVANHVKVAHAARSFARKRPDFFVTTKKDPASGLWRIWRVNGTDSAAV